MSDWNETIQQLNAAQRGNRPSEVAAPCSCSATLEVVKQLTDAMHHHIQEANRYALELRKYALPKLEHDIQTPNAGSEG